MKNNIHQLRLVTQDLAKDSTEGIFSMRGQSFRQLLHNTIREYGHYSDGTYSINPQELALVDMQLILSHILDAEEYEWACATPSRLREVFNDNITHIQEALDDECYFVYCEDMEEMGMARCTHPNNDEVYWLRQ